MTGNFRRHFPLLLPVLSSRDFYQISYDQIVTLLTFQFFKEEFICKDQAWLCAPLNENATPDDDFDRRHLLSDFRNRTRINNYFGLET